jgi:hypothetical protein
VGFLVEKLVMAHAIDLDPRVLEQIAAQVGESLPSGLVRDGGALSLGETFDVWSLSDVGGPKYDIAAAAVSENVYHHQLLQNNEAVGFARSQLLADQNAREVIQVFHSRLAQRIEEAIVDVDRLDTSDALARLLFAPQYQVSAFWLVGPAGQNRCYVIQCPPTLRYVKRGELIEAADFLRQLELERPVIGIDIRTDASKKT